jgi:ABC-2 type transport system permease protein
VSRVLRDTLTLFRRELLRYRRDRAYWVGQLVFPLAFVGFVGAGLDGVVRLPSGVGYLGHLASGILALMAGSGAVGGGFSLIEDRQTGFLRALLVAPVSRTSIVLAKLAARLVATLALVAVLVAVLSAFTDVRPVHPGAALLALTGLTAVFAALGVGLASSLRRLESFRLFAALVTMPLYLFSGIFYPLSTLPAWLRLPAHANPMTYGADLLRFGLLGTSELPVTVSAPMLAGLTLVSVVAAVLLFERGARG